MDFEDTTEEAAFRAKARAFLDVNAERRKPGAVEGYRRGQDARSGRSYRSANRRVSARIACPSSCQEQCSAKIRLQCTPAESGRRSTALRWAAIDSSLLPT